VSDQEVKRTNEIKTAIPLLDAIDIQGKEITADALLTLLLHKKCGFLKEKTCGAP
jgi:predicted transposase YbfD/YdcC